MATGLLFILLVVVGCICIVRPHLILGPALCVYTFEQWAIVNSPFIRAHSVFLNFYIGVLCLGCLVSLVIQGRNPFQPITRGMLALAGLIGLAAVSVVWSLAPEITFQMWTTFAPYLIVFAFLVPLCIQTEDEMRQSLQFSMIAMTVSLLLITVGTSVHAWGRDIVTSEAFTTRFGDTKTRLSPLAVAETAGQALIIVTLLNFRGVQRVWQIARWGVVLAATYIMARSGTRGQLVASLLVVAWFIGASRGYKKQLQVVVGGITLAVLLAATLWSLNQVATGFASDDRWALGRMRESFLETRWQMCSTMITAWFVGGPVAWLLGLGSNASFSPQLLGIYPHVVAIEVLTELGLLGFTLLMMFIVYTYRDLRDCWNHVKHDPQRRGVIMAMTALFTYSLVLTFKQGTLLSHTYFMMFGMVISRVAVDVRSKAVSIEQAKLRQRFVTRLRFFGLRGRLLRPSS